MNFDWQWDEYSQNDAENVSIWWRHHAYKHDKGDVLMLPVILSDFTILFLVRLLRWIYDFFYRFPFILSILFLSIILCV